MNSRQQTRTDSLEVNPDTLCKATHTTSSSKIPPGLHQYIPDIFGRIRCDFWNLLLVNMVILWDTLNNFISQEKRLYDAKAPTTWTISTFTTKSSICRTSLIASNSQTGSVNLTTVAYICVVSLRYPPFSSCMQGFQKKMGDFHFYCVSLFLVTWSREARRCWLNSKTWQNNKSTSSSLVENMLHIHYNKCMKFFFTYNETLKQALTAEQTAAERKPRQSIQSKACSHALRHCHCASEVTLQRFWDRKHISSKAIIGKLFL